MNNIYLKVLVLFLITLFSCGKTNGSNNLEKPLSSKGENITENIIIDNIIELTERIKNNNDERFKNIFTEFEKQLNSGYVLNEFKLIEKNINGTIYWEEVNLLFTLSYPGGSIPPSVMFFLSNSIMVLNSSKIFSDSEERENRYFKYIMSNNNMELISIDTRLDDHFDNSHWQMPNGRGIFSFEDMGININAPAISFLGWSFFPD